MSDADDDDVGLTDGMEPESPKGSDPGGDDGDDDTIGDFESAGSRAVAIPVAAPRGTRPISDKVRELFKQAQAKIKATAKDDLDDSDIDYDEVPAEAAKTSATAQEKPQETVAATPSTSPPEPAPAPSLDPEVTKLRDQWSAKVAELEQREAKIAEAERAGDFAALGEAYFEKGAPAVIELVKKWAKVSNDAELKEEIANLVSELSAQVLGVDVPTDYLDKIASKRAVKSVKAIKESLAKQDSERAAKFKAAQDVENRVRVQSILNQEIAKSEHAQAYPWLMKAAPLHNETPGSIVWDVAERAEKKDGTKLTWQEAAKRADDYFKAKYSAEYDTLKHLLTAAPALAGGESNGKQAQQGDQQVRRSRALTPPTETPATPSANSGRWDPEAHRRAIKSKYRTAFTRSDE